MRCNACMYLRPKRRDQRGRLHRFLFLNIINKIISDRSHFINVTLIKNSEVNLVYVCLVMLFYHAKCHSACVLFMNWLVFFLFCFLWTAWFNKYYVHFNGYYFKVCEPVKQQKNIVNGDISFDFQACFK